MTGRRAALRRSLLQDRLTSALLLAVLTGLVYLVLAVLVSWTTSMSGSGGWVATFWPAAGVNVVVLLLAPRRAWPAVLAAVLLVEVGFDRHHGAPLALAVGWGLANALEPLAAAALLRRGGRSAPDLARRDDLLRFVGCAVLLGPCVGGTVAALTSALLEPSAGAVLSGGLRWVVGDSVGVLTVAPALLALARPVRSPRPSALPVVLVAVGAVVAFAVTELLEELGRPIDGLVTLLLPALAWLALRGGQRAAALGVLLVAVTVEVATATGIGPFASSPETLVDSLLFLAACALTASLVSVATHDLVRRDELAGRLREQAEADALTGLGNRRRVFGRSASLQAEGRGFTACLVVDLDGFKQVNDTYGHACGDEVLLEVARRLTAATRGDDVVARTGGDEFLVCVSRPCNATDLAHLARRIGERVCAPMTVGGQQVQVQASVGTALAAGCASLEDLVREADQVMYRQKQAAALLAQPLAQPLA